MAELGSYLERFTYQELLRMALDQVPNELDKRQGSVIYDALAPACYVIAEAFLKMRQVYNDTYVQTASGEYLEQRVFERGLTRNEPTKAIRKGTFKNAAGDPLAIVIGSRFSTLGTTVNTFTVIEELTIGEYVLECEQAGTGGNGYVGDLLPITYIEPLAEARLTDIIIPGENTESDDELRARYFDEIGITAFAGNIAAYDKMLKNIEGVGDVQVYPTFAGGGTVKLSVVDSTFNPASEAFLDILKEKVDPENYTGSGLGLAPIGHKVTITAPASVPIDISAKITLKGGATLAAAQIEAEEEIRAYIETVANAWGTPDALNNYNANIYTAQITSALLRSPSIGNATNVKTNGNPQDVILEQTANRQEIPIMGTVTLNVS